MSEKCSVCGFRYDRGPGFYLGSIYVNYLLTAFIITASYLYFRMYLGYPNDVVMRPLVIFCVTFPLCFFHYARAIWLAMDCSVDESVLIAEPDERYKNAATSPSVSADTSKTTAE